MRVLTPIGPMHPRTAIAQAATVPPKGFGWIRLLLQKICRPKSDSSCSSYVPTHHGDGKYAARGSDRHTQEIATGLHACQENQEERGLARFPQAGQEGQLTGCQAAAPEPIGAFRTCCIQGVNSERCDGKSVVAGRCHGSAVSRISRSREIRRQKAR